MELFRRLYKSSVWSQLVLSFVAIFVLPTMYPIYNVVVDDTNDNEVVLDQQANQPLFAHSSILFVESSQNRWAISRFLNIVKLHNFLPSKSVKQSLSYLQAGNLQTSFVVSLDQDKQYALEPLTVSIPTSIISQQASIAFIASVLSQLVAIIPPIRAGPATV